uniref:ABC transporter ATP-binding protein n=1 Tax=viral metagenome TaxID=1070528 RepID=A0A6C0K9B4_9ZZZZ
MLMLRRYIDLCGNDIRYSILGLFCGCLGSYYNVIASEQTSRMMIGDFTNERLSMLFYTNLISMIAISLRGGLFVYSQKSMNHKLRCIVYRRILNQPLKFYETEPVNGLLERVNNDARVVSDIISLNINVFSRSLVEAAITFWLLTNISWKLTAIAIILIPINYLISACYEHIHKKIMANHEELNKELNTYTHETISHLSVMKTYANERQAEDKFNTLSGVIADYNYKECMLYGSNLLVVCNIPTITTIIIILSANYLGTVEGLTIFILHNNVLYSTIKTLFDMRNEFLKCKEPYMRITKILDAPEYTKGYYIPADNRMDGDIAFNLLSFKYENATAPVLTDFDFQINRGEKIAIIGASGCGKSTLSKLLVNILEPTDGSITIDGVDIRNYDSEWLKKRIGYVAQDSILFTDTIANNIAYGICDDGAADLENLIIEAAKNANAHEFISKLPNKYQTRLEGTELSSLSGGQKQRIAIARALIRKPQILIFDEATSALDPYCEELVQQTIKECYKTQNSTLIIIAHRRSALEIADKVYELKDSRLVNTSRLERQQA